MIADRRFGARDLVIRVFGSSIAAIALVAIRLSSARRGIALVYHRVGEEQEDPRHELVPALGIRLFTAQLRYLARHYRVVEASALRSAVVARQRGGRIPVAITFDDDLRSHLELAAPALRKAGLPATFFLSGASLQAPFAFWWERLQLLAERGLLAEAREAAQITASRSGLHVGSDVHQIGAALEGLPADDRAEVAAEFGRLLGPDPPDAGLRAREVKALARAGFEIGFHTLRHDRLTSLNDDELREALAIGREELARLVENPLDAVAYPYGKADGRVAAEAARAGFSVGFTGRPEAVEATTEPHLLGRVEPSFRSRGHFALKLVRALLAMP